MAVQSMSTDALYAIGPARPVNNSWMLYWTRDAVMDPVRMHMWCLLGCQRVLSRHLWGWRTYLISFMRNSA